VTLVAGVNWRVETGYYIYVLMNLCTIDLAASTTAYRDACLTCASIKSGDRNPDSSSGWASHRWATAVFGPAPTVASWRSWFTNPGLRCSMASRPPSHFRHQLVENHS